MTDTTTAPRPDQFATEKDFTMASVAWLRHWSAEFAPSPAVEETILIVCDRAVERYKEEKAQSEAPFKVGDTVRLIKLGGPIMLVAFIEPPQEKHHDWAVHVVYMLRDGNITNGMIGHRILEKAVIE